MMQFEAHRAAWFFWVIPILVIAFLFIERRRLGILYRFVSRGELRDKLSEYASWASAAQFSCFLVALLCLGFALLKPYEGFEMREISRKGVDLFFLVDVSPSMLAQDISPSRIERAKFELKDFLAELGGDRVGLIGFSGESFVLVPLTADYRAFGMFLDELDPSLFSIAGTDIPGALAKAAVSFKKESEGEGKAVVLVTDGEDSVGLDASVVDDIKAQGAKVFVIGIGTPEGAPIPLEDGGYKTDEHGGVVVSRLNEPALQNLALATGGGYVRSVSGDMDLKEIYEKGIKRAFTEEDLKKSQKKLPRYRFQEALFAGLCFLLLETLMFKRIGPGTRLLRRLCRRKKTSLATFFLIMLISAPSFAANPFTIESANRDFASGKNAEALKSYESLSASDPADPLVAFNLGDARYRAGKFEEAERAYKQALNLEDPDLRKRALYNLGNTAVRRQNLDEALSYYEKALQIDPDYEKAKLNSDFVQKMQQQQKQQQQQNQNQNDQQKNQDEDQQRQDSQNQQNDSQEKQESQSGDGSGSGSSSGVSSENMPPPQNQNGQGSGSGSGSPSGEASQEPTPDQNQTQNQNGQGSGSGSGSQADAAGTPLSGGGDKNFKGKFDDKADQWLDSIDDEPGQALQYLIKKNSVDNRKRFDKDW